MAVRLGPDFVYKHVVPANSKLSVKEPKAEKKFGKKKDLSAQQAAILPASREASDEKQLVVVRKGSTVTPPSARSSSWHQQRENGKIDYDYCTKNQEACDMSRQSLIVGGGLPPLPQNVINQLTVVDSPSASHYFQGTREPSTSSPTASGILLNTWQHPYPLTKKWSKSIIESCSIVTPIQEKALFQQGAAVPTSNEVVEPVKKGMEAVGITASTGKMAIFKETAEITAQQHTKPGPCEQILGSTKLFVRPLGERQIHVSEEWAMEEGFDRHFNQENGQIDHGYRSYIALPEHLLDKLRLDLIECDGISDDEKRIKRKRRKNGSERFHSKKSRPSPPSYKINQHDIHGCALVINIINYPEKKRRGAEYDTEKVERLMADLKYKLVGGKVHVDCTAEEIERLMSEAMSIDHNCHDSFILIIMAHGKDGYIYGSDYRKVRIENLFQEMRKVSSLKGKPKISIIQACRLNADDDQFEKTVYLKADEVVGYATIPNAIAYRHTARGAIYITEVCKAFKLYPQEDILGILTIANGFLLEEYSERQVSVIKSTLSKKFYLK